MDRVACGTTVVKNSVPHHPVSGLPRHPVCRCTVANAATASKHMQPITAVATARDTAVADSELWRKKKTAHL